MSSTASPPGPKPAGSYTGSTRYVEWARDYLGVDLSAAQQEILEAVADHRHVHVEAANGLGKSYAVACLSLSFLFVHHPATVYATSGTYPKLRRTLCKPIKKLHRDAHAAHNIPGQYKESPPRIEFDQDPAHYFEAARPKDPDELEGAHNDHLLAIVEEADKESVNEEVIESMDSTLTDKRDRMIVIGNPPRSESNVVHDLAESDSWHTLRYSSFDSRNVKVDAGLHDGPRIDGLVGLSKVKENWTEWNGREWPGYETARDSSTDETLDERWFRRRLGRMPPLAADSHRPFTVEDVDAAFERDPQTVTETPHGLGMDVARMGGDSNALIGVFADDLRVLDRWKGTDHNENEARLRGLLNQSWQGTLAIDATPEGSGLADRVTTFYPPTCRYNNGETAIQETVYRDCWTEALACLGETLRNGASFENRRLREELLAAARVVEYDEAYLASRDDEVLTATSKSEIADYLGRSPDCLDAAAMACWAAAPETDQTQAIDSTWCDARV